jgi:hypothetical protein
MNNIEVCLIIIAVALLMLIWGVKMKDAPYFKGQFKIIGIGLTFIGIICLVESLQSSSPSNVHNQVNESVLEKGNDSSALNKDSKINEGTESRFIPANDLPGNLSNQK